MACSFSPILHLYKTLPSTNDTAFSLAREGAPHGTLILADHQTKGRGQRQRKFVSPKDSGLYMSLVIRRTLPLSQAGFLTCAAAVAVCRGVKEVLGKELSIKWVNDLFYKGKKCGGILTECSSVSGKEFPNYLVVGIGLNLLPPKEGWPEEVEQIAGTILEEGEDPQRNRLALCIAEKLLEFCEELTASDFMEEYRTKNLAVGRKLWLLQGEEKILAFGKTVTEEGHLLVAFPDGTERELSCGEVRVVSS